MADGRRGRRSPRVERSEAAMPYPPDPNAHPGPSHRAHDDPDAGATVAGMGPVERSIVAQLPDVVLRLDRDGRILFANEAIRGVAGLPPAHCVGRLVQDLVADPDVARRLAAAQEAAVAPGRPITSELRLDDADGPRWFDLRLAPERAAGDAARSVLALGREVTAARRAMAVVRASEARCRALVEATGQVVWGAGPNGQLGDALDGWLASTGQVGDPARRDSGDEWLEVVHPDDRAAARAAWTRALRTGSLHEARYRLHRCDGAWRTVVARAAPVRGADVWEQGRGVARPTPGPRGIEGLLVEDEDDVLVTDLRMPGMGRRALVKRLRAAIDRARAATHRRSTSPAETPPRPRGPW
jgi:PAS domain S-box-containing protein